MLEYHTSIKLGPGSVEKTPKSHTSHEHPTGPGHAWQRTFRRVALSWFGCGLSPVAPGTVGSLGAIPLAAVIHWGFGAPTLMVLAMVVFFAGWAISAAHLAEEPGEDPQWIVIDEVAGQWLALAAVPLHPAGYLLAFALFRLFDSGECRPCTAKNRSYTFGAGDTAVTVTVKVDGSETFGDPFDKARLWKFKCPSAL